MATMLKTGSTKTATVTWVDAEGNPSIPESATSWSSSNSTIVSVEPDSSGDSTKATLTAEGPSGSVDITASVQSDEGNGPTTITADLGLLVITGQPSSGTIDIQDVSPPPPLRTPPGGSVGGSRGVTSGTVTTSSKTGKS